MGQTCSICRQWVSLLLPYSEGSRLFLLIFSSKEVSKNCKFETKPSQNYDYLTHLHLPALQVFLSSLYSDFECTSVLLLPSHAVERKERRKNGMCSVSDTVLLMPHLCCTGRLFHLSCWSLRCMLVPEKLEKFFIDLGITTVLKKYRKV